MEKSAQKARNTELQCGEKIAGRDFSLCSEEHNLQRLQRKQEELTAEEEMKQ